MVLRTLGLKTLDKELFVTYLRPGFNYSQLTLDEVVFYVNEAGRSARNEAPKSAP